jgi:hypothetical protein
MIPAAWPRPLAADSAETERTTSRKRRWLLLLLALFVWLPSACSALLTVDLYRDSLPQRGILLADPDVDLLPGLVQATSLQAMGMLPGDRELGEIRLLNRSVVPVRLSLNAEVESDVAGLASALIAVIRLAPAGGCTGSGGQILYGGSLAEARFTPIPGDTDAPTGLVDAATAASLCVAVSLPVWAGNDYQRALSSVNLMVTTQVDR